MCPDAVEPATRPLHPVSERVLATLGRRRRLGIAVWALVPWVNAGVNLLLGDRTSAVWEQGAVLVVLNYGALSLAVALSLWARDALLGVSGTSRSRPRNS